MQVNCFSPGDIVEIIKTSKLTTSFHPATILLQDTLQPNSTKNRKKRKKKKQTHHDDDSDDDDDDDDDEDLYLVQLQTQKDGIVSYVGSDEIRPSPPQNDAVSCGKFVVNDKVNVLRDGYWIKGTIVGVLYEGTKYLVSIDGDADDLPVEVCRSYLRVHRDWCNGSWVPPFEGSYKKETISEVITDSNCKQVTLRRKGIKTLLKTKFSPGTLVEVKSEDDGYQGSWYTATVVRSVGIGKFLVEYKTLTNEDKTKHLRDIANEQDIRPCPPHIPQINRYNVFDEVDAWYNDGWWEGAIYEVLDDWKYIVYFARTNEKLNFQHSDLRPHQNWVDGKWIIALQNRSSDSNLRRLSSEIQYNQCEADKIFGNGTIVEVRSDEPGYEGSWFTAIIVKSTKRGRFLVEYLTLKTDDEKSSLREEVEYQYVRPCPPKQVNERYLLHDKVDAWYNDGWWVGAVSKVLAHNKYKVYFDTSNEELEFHHVHLRTHQEWINGKWIDVI